jgi:hypothetical protein
MAPLKKLRGTKPAAQDKWAGRKIPKLFYAWAEAQEALIVKALVASAQEALIVKALVASAQETLIVKALVASAQAGAKEKASRGAKVCIDQSLSMPMHGYF